MSDFDKVKIGFVLALLGSVFALHPIVNEYRELGFQIVTFKATVWRVYLVFAIALSLSVYLYALTIITEKPFSWTQKAGNLSYAISLLLLPAYVLLWAAVATSEAISNLLNDERIRAALVPAASALVGFGTALVGRRITARLAKREKHAAAKQYTVEEADHIGRAEKMLEARHYDLAAIESARAIEAALRRAVLDAGFEVQQKGLRQLVEQAIRAGAVPPEARRLLEKAGRIRNTAVHSVEPISADDARLMTETARRVLAMVRYPNEDEEQYDQPTELRS